MNNIVEEVIALFFGNDDNIIWLVILIIILVNVFDRRESIAKVEECCDKKDEPVYIYRNPNRNKPRRRLVY